MIFLLSCLEFGLIDNLWSYINPALRWCLACRLNFTSELLKTWSLHLGFRWCFDQFHTSSCNFQAISSFMLNILEVSCCWAIRWGVAFPRQKFDVAWTSFGRRSDVVFSCFFLLYIISLISHFTFRFTIHFTVQQTIIKIDPSAACSAAHATQNPTLPIGYRFIFETATALCGATGTS